MPRAIAQVKGNLTIALTKLAADPKSKDLVKKDVHDGDTVNVEPAGYFGVRFLGMDTPEISFKLPKQTAFKLINNPEWEKFLADPSIADYLPSALAANIKPRLGADVAASHYQHALAGKEFLANEVSKDITELKTTPDQFQLFLAFANEILDGYGRFLAYINRSQQSGIRPLDYNSRLLQAGLAVPYFIWPNIDPFRKVADLVKAVPQPGTANKLATSDPKLSEARRWVSAARTSHVGIFDKTDPLKLLPFELRFLGGQKLPSRWVIDLGKTDKVILKPENYFQIEKIEDRLFIPPEYVPLFVEQGWTRQQ